MALLKDMTFTGNRSPNHSHFVSVNLSSEFALKRDALE